MQEIVYKKLCKDDLNAFILMRMDQLQEEGSVQTFDLEPALQKYYEKHINDNTFVSWNALDNGKIIATSGISFIEKPPYYSNPNGRIGILSSMYTLKEYRRKGIAKKLLGKVIDEAKAYDCTVVQITASDAGVLLYADYGFKKNENFMQYNIT